MYIVLIIFICIGLAVLLQHRELKKYKVTSYQIESDKIKEPIKAVMLADLHSHVFEPNNEPLLRSVEEAQPDLILITGDMITAKYKERYFYVADFVTKLTKIAPVYYSMGNHETRVKMKDSICHEDYMEYEQQLRNAGVTILDNENTLVEVNHNQLMLYGLSLEHKYYEKRKKIVFDPQTITSVFQEGTPEYYQILLAHTPSYSEHYAAWGADLTLCGHNHGGLIRIPGVGSVFSPQFEWFPKYDAGRFEIDGKNIIISKGLGTHTFHIRIFDRAEVVQIEINPTKH